MSYIKVIIDEKCIAHDQNTKERAKPTQEVKTKDIILKYEKYEKNHNTMASSTFQCPIMILF